MFCYSQRSFLYGYPSEFNTRSLISRCFLVDASAGGGGGDGGIVVVFFTVCFFSLLYSSLSAQVYLHSTPNT